MNPLKALVTFFLILSPHLIFSQLQENRLLQTEDITIRDPYIFADTVTQSYYMYAQIDNRLVGQGGADRPKGVEVYVSSDLKEWKQPQTVLLLPDAFWAREMVWAPEMHEYNGRYYMFVTLTSSQLHDHMQNQQEKQIGRHFIKEVHMCLLPIRPWGPSVLLTINHTRPKTGWHWTEHCM